MIRRLAIPALLTLTVFVGCSDDAAVNPSATPSDDEDGAALEIADETYWNDASVSALDDEFTGLARVDARDDLGVDRTVRTYEITIENLTANNGNGASQVFSPPVLASHDPSVRMFRVGDFASDELAGIAEDAVNQPMVDLLESSGRTHEIVVGDGPIMPGASATYTIATRAGRRSVSAVWMLVNTNDAISGLDAIRLPAHGETSYDLFAYDAGSEVNDELEASIPGPCCGNKFAGTDEREPIARHEGITGIGDLDPEVWGFEGAVARVTVRRLAPAFEVTLRNLTPDTGDGGAQVFSPPVLASHSPRARIFRVGSFASDELAGVAEDALNMPLVDRLEATERALDVFVGDGPIFPGDEATWTIRSDRGFRRLSAVFMLVNTNDAFSGVDRVRFPRGGSVTYRLKAYDAGSEFNDELAVHIPGPCCGSVGAGVEERARIGPHPGLHGDGDLDVAKYGWDEPAAELTITRVR